MASLSASRVRRTSPGLSSTSRISIGVVTAAIIALLSLSGEREVEGRALAGLGLDPDAPAVALDDLLADRQADAGARVLVPAVQALEDDEDALEVLRVDADAVVAHREDPLAAVLRAAETWTRGGSPRRGT